MKLIEYACTDKDCKKLFYIPRIANPFTLGERKPNEANCCPFCGKGGLFNVTYEEELGSFKLK